MKVYLAGPMRGIPHFNFPAFHAAARDLRAAGHEVFNPAEGDIKRLGADPSVDNPTGDVALAAKRHGFDRGAALRADIRWILDHAEAICLLPGWERSEGACAECGVAMALGLELIWPCAGKP